MPKLWRKFWRAFHRKFSGSVVPYKSTHYTSSKVPFKWIFTTQKENSNKIWNYDISAWLEESWGSCYIPWFFNVNVKKYSPHCNLGHCLSYDGSKVVIKFVYCMTWPFVWSGISYTEGDAIMTGSLQANTVWWWLSILCHLFLSQNKIATVGRNLMGF